MLSCEKILSRFADHDKRMPAVLHEENIPTWLGQTNAPIENIVACLRTYEGHGAWDMHRAVSCEDTARASIQSLKRLA